MQVSVLLLAVLIPLLGRALQAFGIVIGMRGRRLLARRVAHGRPAAQGIAMQHHVVDRQPLHVAARRHVPALLRLLPRGYLDLDRLLLEDVSLHYYLLVLERIVPLARHLRVGVAEPAQVVLEVRFHFRGALPAARLL